MSSYGAEAARLQKFIAFAWAEVLGLGSIEPDEDFHFIGGDSLAALAVSKKFVEFSGEEWPEDGMISGPFAARHILEKSMLSDFAKHLAESEAGKAWTDCLLENPPQRPDVEQEVKEEAEEESLTDRLTAEAAAEYKTLRIASAAGQIVEMKKLMESGINPNGGSGKDCPILVGVPALHAAAHRSQPQAVELLLKAGALPNSKMYFYKRTAAHCAAYAGCQQSLQLLLDHGAAVRAKDKCRMTLMHHAARGGNATCIRALLQSSCAAEIDSRDKWGRSPLHWTVLNGQAEAAKVLIEAGAVVEPPKMPNRVQRRRTSLVQPPSLRALAKELLPQDHKLHEVLLAASYPALEERQENRDSSQSKA